MKKVFVILLFLAACEDAPVPGSSDGIVVITDQSAYSRTEPTGITILNRSEVTLAVSDCGTGIYYTRQKWVDDAWVDWTSAACDVTQSRVIAHGELLYDTIRVRKPGIYRFRYDFTPMDDTGSTISAYSNSFEIY